MPFKILIPILFRSQLIIVVKLSSQTDNSEIGNIMSANFPLLFTLITVYSDPHPLKFEAMADLTNRCWSQQVQSRQRRLGLRGHPVGDVHVRTGNLYNAIFLFKHLIFVVYTFFGWQFLLTLSTILPPIHHRPSDTVLAIIYSL